MLFLPKDIVLRGEEGTVLALPAPALTSAAAEAGARELELTDAHEFVGDTRVQILPPIGSEFFGDGATKSLELQPLVRVEGRKLVLAEPLGLALPAGSRVGYPHKLLWVHPEGLATIEDLAFEGGRVEAIPMPGHSQRCAIWASAPFGFEQQRLGPPGRGVVVRRCRFSDWYGRGVAFYNHEDGVVEDCRFERISDEAIDLDHFVERFRIARNEVRDVLWGIVLNDASRNVVEANEIEGCDIGIWSWQYELTPRQGINEENVIRANVIRGARQDAIRIDKSCVRYVIRDNQVEGSIVVVEADNTVGPNTQL
ncbi:MAG: right-handed parallel beta-helix repeat-containing protein [Planctomycetes bacterium]|nr:right-handed parallel beta-helix repeat-containing protein [Planctomycetota bacterium]